MQINRYLLNKHRLTFEMKNEYKIKTHTKYFRQSTIITRLGCNFRNSFCNILLYFLGFSPQSFCFNYITVHGKIKNKKNIRVHLS